MSSIIPLAERTFPLPDDPCPDCGQFTLFGYYFVTEDQHHQHTHYVCTFWPSIKGLFQRQCGWHGWTVPTQKEDQ